MAASLPRVGTASMGDLRSSPAQTRLHTSQSQASMSGSSWRKGKPFSPYGDIDAS